MKAYLLSLAVGLLVGIIYALFNVRSPAPPVIALIGLLGILLGEQIPPLVKQVLKVETANASWLHDQVKPHMFGQLPTCTQEPARCLASEGSRAPQAEAGPPGRT